MILIHFVTASVCVSAGLIAAMLCLLVGIAAAWLLSSASCCSAETAFPIFVWTRFCLALSGRANREISEALHISENTVKTHLHSIYSKYAVGSRAELISMLLQQDQD